jgi:glycerol-3-phosphate dehydrogenase
MDNKLNVDLLILGGGINGTGIAADAAGRGLKVILCEVDDLASATSSWSTKLIHGGLRYLEYYKFKMVREALQEREILIHKAPFLIHPLEFILPHANHLRPKWMIRAGLFLYDHLAKRTTIPSSHQVNLTNTVYGYPLKTDFRFGFSYYDCQTDDARLVILNALAAKEQGASILTRTTCQNIKRFEDHWHIELNSQQHNIIKVDAKIIINATGPWVSETLDNLIQLKKHSPVTLVKGSHIVVPKLYAGDHAYILQHTDKRIVFAIPYQQQFTLIGTTDINFHGAPRSAKISDDEIDYLCGIINHYFNHSISSNNVVWHYSGVRPLFSKQNGDAATITREYHLELDQSKAPILSIFGGKLTSYRRLAEKAVNQLTPFFPNIKPAWTSQAYLPGGDLGGYTVSEYLAYAQRQFPWLPPNILRRYVLSYGSRISELLRNAERITDLGTHFGAGLYASEVDFLMQNEWAMSTEDILWRRSKLGLFLSAAEQEKLAIYNHLN